MEKEKILEYDVIRIFATLLVVIGHSAYFVMGDGNNGVNFPYGEYFSSQSNMIYTYLNLIVNWIYSFHMPLFFFLSGAVFGIKSLEHYNFNNLLIDKIKRLIIPFLIILFLFSVPLKTIAGYYSMANVADALKNALVNPLVSSGHLWFLVYLFWVFILFYPIVKVLKNKSALILIICLGMMGVSNLFPYFDIPLYGNPFLYIFWFALGYVFNQNRKIINDYLLQKGISVIISFGAMSILNIKWGFLSNFFQILISIVFVYGLCLCMSKYKSIYTNKFFTILNRNSFGIYLFHDPLNYIFLYIVSIIGIYKAFYLPLILIAFILIRIFGNIMICCIFSSLLKKSRKILIRLENKTPQKRFRNSFINMIQIGLFYLD